MKKSVKNFNAGTVSRDIASRKKRKRSILKDSAAHKVVLSKKTVGGSWESEASNTTKSDSINIKEKCLVEETNMNYGKKCVFNKDDSN
ncbi:hypothetical protein G9A89_014019 [Geosiphon pyriformis]|nr:hypothetical protein G9A89_014019 [Geosiphon pyriformis]